MLSQARKNVVRLRVRAKGLRGLRAPLEPRAAAAMGGGGGGLAAPGWTQDRPSEPASAWVYVTLQSVASKTDAKADAAAVLGRLVSHAAAHASGALDALGDAEEAAASGVAPLSEKERSALLYGRDSATMGGGGAAHQLPRPAWRSELVEASRDGVASTNLTAQRPRRRNEVTVVGRPGSSRCATRRATSPSGPSRGGRRAARRCASRRRATRASTAGSSGSSMRTARPRPRARAAELNHPHFRSS